jgi:tetratricopeptide (TPR) repeat protein
MSQEPKPPERPAKARVISLVDRLPPARRAILSLRDHVRGRDQLKVVEALAKHIADLNPSLAFAELKRIGSVMPNDVTAAAVIQCMVAAQRLLDGDAEGAFADWARLLVEFPDQAADVLTVRCVFRMLRNELPEALDDVTRALELEPRKASHYARRGDILVRMDRDAEAMANFRRAVQLDHDDLLALAGLGLCSLDAGDAAGGLPFYTRAVRHAPRIVELRLGRSLCFEELGRHEEAIADIEEALRCDPKDAGAHYARGRIRPNAERAEAIADFTRSIALDDENPEVLAARAHAHQMLDDLDAAVSDATRALALAPDHRTALFTRAIALHRRGDHDEARVDYDHLVEVAPDELDYAEMREQALEHMARVERGKKKD